MAWPTDSDIANFEEHGWVTSPGLLPEDLLDEAAEAVEAYYLGERDHTLPVSGFLDWRPEHGDGLRLNDYVSLQSDVLRKLVCWPGIGRAAAALLRVDRVRLFHDQLITKPPVDSDTNTAVGWHTDKAYWRTCSSDRMVTAWIPFQDCPESAGPIAVVDGSHKWSYTDWMCTFDIQEFASIEEHLGRSIHGQPLVLKRGQVSFHHARTVHGSFANRSGGFRTALAVHIQDAENTYVRAVGTDGRSVLHINDVLCRPGADGTPDYWDPYICPVLWPLLR